MLRHFKAGKFHPDAGTKQKHPLMKLDGCKDSVPPTTAPFSTFCDRFLVTASEMGLFEAVWSQNKEKNVEIFGTPGVEDLAFPCVDHWQLVILKE